MMFGKHAAFVSGEVIEIHDPAADERNMFAEHHGTPPFSLLYDTLAEPGLRRTSRARSVWL